VTVVQEEKDLHVFLWRGSQATAVFGAAAAMAGLPNAVHDLGLTLAKTNAAQALPRLRGLAAEKGIDAAKIAAFVENIAAGKFREQVPQGLARSLWARQNAGEISEVSAMARTL
jgi:ATP-dependent helicase Lhr and Lhr-like helicase